LQYKQTDGRFIKKEEEIVARIVKEKEYAVKRNEILDAAQQLIYTKGYDQMTIQDILENLQISKGAFYHYFDSKPTLLEELVLRMVDQVQQLLLSIVQDSSLGTLDKFQHFFAMLSQWKSERKDFFLELLRVWYADENALVRHKLNIARNSLLKPMLITIIQQGIQEGVFTTSFPDQASDITLSLLYNLGDTIARLFSSLEPEQDEMRTITTTIDAYTDALERVLGAPSHSLQLIDTETLNHMNLPVTF
jgi:AcrR family transcriptional regulator